MPPELLREVREWRRKAAIDLGAAHALLCGERTFPSVAVFLCQYAESLIMRSRVTRREEMARSLGKLSAPLAVDNFA